MITDNEISIEAKLRHPYLESDNHNRIHKIASRRRNFIEGAQWMRYELERKQHVTITKIK